MDDRRMLLQRYFGHSEFRPGQEALVDALLSGRDVLGVMPTGAGKSICYQLPALLLPGMTLVICPLISLMKDQVASLNQMGIPAAFINSSQTFSQQQEVLYMASKGAYKIIYVAPERLTTEVFCDFTSQYPISLLAVDEAHCVSQWGQDFRPSYLDISRFAESLPERPVIGAFTATATEEVKEDIERLLLLRDPLCVTTGFDRPNLFFAVERPKDKLSWVLNYLNEHPTRSGIIYCATRKRVEEVCEKLSAKGISATRYHAGLEDEERRGNQDDFVFDRARVMVATNAFGMGIDKSNVGFVLHYNMPKNIESYYQEAGRAGRDGSQADCILLFSQGDVNTARFLIENGEENERLSEEARRELLIHDLQKLKSMEYYCKTSSCLRSALLNYFGEEGPEDCGSCGNCTSHMEQVEITREAQKILSGVVRVNRMYSSGLGIQMVIRMLRGSKEKRILQLGLDTLPTYGIMSELSQDQVREYVDFLLANEYLCQSEGELPVLLPGKRARAVLFEGEAVLYTRRVAPVKEAAVKLPAAKSGEDDGGLLSRLKRLRFRLAQEQNVPSYIVFSNAALEDMAMKQPATKDDFLKVSGVGAVKAERYGEQFLAEIRAWQEENA